MNIVIAGLGRYESGVELCLQQDVVIEYYLDNAICNRNRNIKGKKILSHYQSYPDYIDYVVIAIMGYESLREELIERGFSKEIIIPFFDLNFDLREYSFLFVSDKAIEYSLRCNLDFLNRKMEDSKRTQQFWAEHFLYEAVDLLHKNRIHLPRVCSVEETLKKIITEKDSISRYGDGEFEIIFGNAKAIYQDNNSELANRLKEILKSQIQHHLVALADDYGDLSELREENRNDIRKYMTLEKRKQHYQYLDMDRQYYNAYISRPYVIYPHEQREKAKRRFDGLKQIWCDENVLVIEGEYTRMGVGNDLFENAISVQRIIAPSTNAYGKYDELLRWAKYYGKDMLILIALGPTATVLAYDLAKDGYWAVDIGHLDLEYEWYLKGEGYSYIPAKYNNEVLGDDEVVEIKDEEYERSILKKVLF